MVSLVKEDGSGVTGANTYLEVLEAEAILENIGYSFDAAITPDQKAQFLIRSSSYIETFRASFSGCKTSSTQGLQWPRYGASIDGYPIPSDSVPFEIQQAQALGAYYESIGKSLQPVTDGKEVKLKEISGAVKVEYFENGAESGVSNFNDIEQLLKPFFGNGGRLGVLRI